MQQASPDEFINSVAFFKLLYTHDKEQLKQNMKISDSEADMINSVLPELMREKAVTEDMIVEKIESMKEVLEKKMDECEIDPKNCPQILARHGKEITMGLVGATAGLSAHLFIAPKITGEYSKVLKIGAIVMSAAIGIWIGSKLWNWRMKNIEKNLGIKIKV